MMLMDFIMSQADRFSGNMHSEKVYLWVENGVLKTKTKKSDPAKAAEQLKQIPSGAVLVDRMIMKDNDAGLISGNSAKSNHLLEKISHMDSKTYDRLLDLQKELQKPEVAQWYQTEILFTPADFNTIKDNVDQAVAILTARKDKGLFLDANVSCRSRGGRQAGTGGRNGPEPDNGTSHSACSNYRLRRPLGKGRAVIFQPMWKLCNASWERRRKSYKLLSLIRRGLMERLRGYPGSRIRLLRSKPFKAVSTFRLMA